MPTAFDGVVNDAKGELFDVARNLLFLQNAFRVYARNGEFLARSADSQELRTLLLDFKKCGVEDLNGIYQALYVQLCAIFELFVRRLILAYVKELCRIRPDYTAIESRQDQSLLRN